MNLKYSLLALGLLNEAVKGELRATSPRDADSRDLKKVSTSISWNEELEYCWGAQCGMWGDPHIITCDGTKYDCQGIGLFTLMKNSLFNIQSRFVDVGKNEHKLVQGWGLTHGASITNDVVIKVEGDRYSDYPIIQMGIGDVEVEENVAGCGEWRTFKPVNMPGQKRSVERTVQGCRARCEDTPGCSFFSWWADGGCHLNNGDQKEVDSNRGWSKAFAGSLDGDCGKPPAPPSLAESEEEKKYGILGHNDCPSVLHIDGEMVDLSFTRDMNRNQDIFLYGSAEDDVFVKQNNKKVIIAYKMKDADGNLTGEYSEVVLYEVGHGPGRSWSCHYDVIVCLASSLENELRDVTMGLLGNADGNGNNDWMTKEGTQLQIDKAHGSMYDYCLDNWCVGEDDSHFTYHRDLDWDDVKCERGVGYDNPDIDDDCGITRHEIIDYCKDFSDSTRHGCEVDCCHAECPEEDVVEVFERLGSDEPEKNIIVVHNECDPDEKTFENTPDKVCPGQNTVTLVHSEGGVDLPEDAPIFYGITQDSDPNPGDFTSTLIRFYVQNPFPETTADVYVKHETSHVAGFLDSKCTEMDQVTGGCDDDVEAIEVACHEYDDKNPFALVTLYFTGTDIGGKGEEVEVDKCCEPQGVDVRNTVKYTFAIECVCPDDAGRAGAAEATLRPEKPRIPQ